MVLLCFGYLHYIKSKSELFVKNKWMSKSKLFVDGKHFAMLLYPKFRIVIPSSLFWISSSLFLRKWQRARSAVKGC